MVTFDTFKGYLQALHARSGDEAMMYNCAKDLGGGVFSYAYDGLVTEVLRFNEDGSVDEWSDAAPGDHEYYEPHLHHVSVEEWMGEQVERVKVPD